MTIAVLGLGLMGGSLAWAVKKRGVGRVHGYARREVTRRLAQEKGICDQVFDEPSAAAAGCDLAIICTPVMTVPELLEKICGRESRFLATDVSSTKEWVVQQCESRTKGTGVRFVGSHPICGSEKSGIEHADPDLYEGAVTVVTPTPSTDAADEEYLTSFWRGVGCRVMKLAAPEHDRILARTSHLPHLLAALLVHEVGRGDTEKQGQLCGSGFSDTTRIAAGPAAVWRDIFLTNTGPLLQELAAVSRELERVRQWLEEGRSEEIERWLATAQRLRDRILHRSGE